MSFVAMCFWKFDNVFNQCFFSERVLICLSIEAYISNYFNFAVVFF